MIFTTKLNVDILCTLELLSRYLLTLNLLSQAFLQDEYKNCLQQLSYT